MLASLLLAVVLYESPSPPGCTKIWSFATKGGILGAVLSRNGGTLYIGTDEAEEAYVYAVDTATGKQTWVQHKAVSSSYSSPPALSPDSKTVFTCIVLPDTGAGTNLALQALDAASGTHQWTLDIFESKSDEKWRVLGPTVAPNGHTVYTTYSNGNYSNGEFVAVNVTSRKQLWATQTVATSSPAVSPDSKTVYIASHHAKMRGIYALDAATGKTSWSFKSAGNVRSAPAIAHDSGTVYVGSEPAKEDGKYTLYAIDAASGQQVWAFTPTATGGLGCVGRCWSSPTLSASGDLLYITAGDAHMYALHTASGKLAWRFLLTGGEYLVSDPVLSPDGATVYLQGWFAFNRHHVYAVNAQNGRSLWTCMPGTGGSRVNPLVSPDGSQVYLGDLDNNMYAVTSGHTPPVAKNCCEPKKNHSAYKPYCEAQKNATACAKFEVTCEWESCHGKAECDAKKGYEPYQHFCASIHNRTACMKVDKTCQWDV